MPYYHFPIGHDLNDIDARLDIGQSHCLHLEITSSTLFSHGIQKESRIVTSSGGVVKSSNPSKLMFRTSYYAISDIV